MMQLATDLMTVYFLNTSSRPWPERMLPQEKRLKQHEEERLVSHTSDRHSFFTVGPLGDTALLCSCAFSILPQLSSAGLLTELEEGVEILWASLKTSPTRELTEAY